MSAASPHLHCKACLVGWAAIDGPNCWSCGQPGDAKSLASLRDPCRGFGSVQNTELPDAHY